MTPRKHPVTGQVEQALSCSRLRLTSPRELLDQLHHMPDPIDPAGWEVCWFRVADVVRIEDGRGGHLAVLPDPTDADPGHCGIYGSNGTPCPTTKRAARKLAKIARMLSDEQVASIKAGDVIADRAT